MPKKNITPLTVAYFTMEIGLDSKIPTYAGGLGMLAADIMRSCTDMQIPSACVSICWQHGYLKQKIALDGTQAYEEFSWKPSKFMKKLKEKVVIKLDGRDVYVGGWQYDLKPLNSSRFSRAFTNGESREATRLARGKSVPIIFLDTNLEENSEEDRGITRQLYGGDGNDRLKQEAVLGIGGVKMLRALGYKDINTFHMNEGHAALLTLELLRERDYKDEEVRKACAFTTHTPVPAGHDHFDYEMAHRILGDMIPWHIKDIAGNDNLSMTHLAMHLSHYTCGVSKIHGEVSRNMFPGEKIDSITNGVHINTWISTEMKKVFSKFAKGWEENPKILSEKCRDIPDEALWNAHMKAKDRLIKEVNKHTVTPFDSEHLTISSARRVVSYKRPELLYKNLIRLRDACQGNVQIIHAGNAHPADAFGQSVIKRMIERSKELRDCVRIVYLENYNPELAKLLVQGTDVWLNTPTRLHEASGTSGMKACLNGALNLSTLDGWWAEAYEIDPEAGWRIGPLANAAGVEDHTKVDAEDLYTQLQFQVVPEYYYSGRERWIRRMKRAIGLIGYFNTNRCVEEYIKKAWS
ncbi:alpha-glucan family phosphorylase [Candidatus Peribacteria bacterium]|nr:alpha-glucan family phosphorylase [Candidatus Peribacteria bacterium]MBT4020967.1 alpha-glucan family phosphorylase [Candidatus Peribacteria bacterium]MBT4240317.1 alpha-glucan family phosphorylase [Candidatus Peribacteria bacterium]MBT4474085.1 alpha-glucan family phosphorylase [Candidatus Peribacteria bacterium]